MDFINSHRKSPIRVVIIMSVYNAENYLSEQIDSILSQRGAKVILSIRDDGSIDQTSKILENYASTDSRVTYYKGPNLGAMNSFLEALFDCPLKGDFYGFADADDFWVPEKLEYTIGIINRITRSHNAKGRPVAVSTKLTIVNEKLEIIGETPTPRRKLCFENALIDSVASGATIIMNNSAYDLIRESRPTRAVMHDAWVYLLVSAFGIFGYGDHPTVLYRQHATNVIGTAHRFDKRLALRLRRFRTFNPYWAQALEFAKLFRHRLEPRKRRILDDYLFYRDSFASRLRFAFNPSVKVQSRKANFFYRLLFLLGRG